MKNWLLSILLIVGFSSSVQAAEIEEVLAKAVSAQDSGDYEEALNLYSLAIDMGHENGHVYYNMGNLYYRMGEKGKATAAYLAARKYIPRDPDVKANLKHAKKAAVDKLKTEMDQSPWQRMLFWVGTFNFKEQYYAIGVFWGLAFVLFFLGRIIPTQTYLTWSGISLLVCALLMIGGVSLKEMNTFPWGAITAESAQVYSGPNENVSTVLFEIHHGAPLEVQLSENQWRKVRLSDGKSGWVRSKDLLVF